MRFPARRMARMVRHALFASAVSASPFPFMPRTARPRRKPGPAGNGTFLLTIFLKHDESKTLPQINQQLKEQGYFKQFPPPGMEVVSWYVMMGIGQG